MKLQSPIDLDSDGFVAEVKKIRGKKKPLTAAWLKALRDSTPGPSNPPETRGGSREAGTRDQRPGQRRLRPDPRQVALLWATAPPRMPIERPALQKQTD